MEHDPWIHVARTRSSVRLVALAITCATLGVLAAAGQARAQDVGLPAQLVVTVVAPNGHEPRPTGDVVVSVNDRPRLTIALIRGLEPLTAITPLANATLAALGQRVTIGYTGDNNYEASDGLILTVPTSRALLTIVPRLRDAAPPAIEIVSPGDGVRYQRGESVVAIYSCTDPEARSPVTRCEGSVPSGATIDTASPGRFTVTASDDLGNATQKSVTYTVGSGGGPSDPTPAAAGSSPRAAPAPPPAPAAAAPAVAAAPAGVAVVVAPSAAVDAPKVEDPAAPASEEKAPASPRAPLRRTPPGRPGRRPAPRPGTSPPRSASSSPPTTLDRSRRRPSGSSPRDSRS